MIRILIHSHDPAFCLAAEEYILENYTSDEYIMLWRGERSVIIGKNQNAYGEVSLTQCEKYAVPIYRRNSGGGTVYHDLGNINFSFFSDMGESTDYSRFLVPVRDFLRTLGIPAELGSSFDITVQGKKISGNAQAVHRGRVMHHGTLLFDADLGVLSTVTSHAREKAVSKAVKSNPSPVGNVSEFIPSMTAEDFEDGLGKYFTLSEKTFSREENDIIKKLADEKYRTWDWIFGRSPRFDLNGENITLTAKNGVIISAGEYSAVLNGMRLIPSEIYEAVSRNYGVNTAERLIKDIFE